MIQEGEEVVKIEGMMFHDQKTVIGTGMDQRIIISENGKFESLVLPHERRGV
jgi:hypothetical protein